MSNLKELVNGALDNVIGETIDSDKLYNVDDFPENSITNEQMSNAISENYKGFFEENSVYLCIDNGTYLANTFYKFTGSSWEEIFITASTAYNVAFSTTSTDYTQDGNNYKLIKTVTGLKSYDKVVLVNDDTFINTYNGVITNETDGELVFTINAIPASAFTIKIIITKCKNGGDL